jgi:hypothetical protein
MWVVAALGMVGAVVPRPARAVTVVLPRPGQVGLSGTGEFGTLLNSGDLGKVFGSGAGLSVRLRYRLRYERALGLSFESQKLDVRDPAPAESLTAPLQLSVLLSGIEFYQMFKTRTRTQPMLSVGAGLAQFHREHNDGEFSYPGDGVYVSLAGGVERYFYRSLAFDVSTRYIGLFHEGKTDHDVQAAVGIIFYASY